MLEAEDLALGFDGGRDILVRYTRGGQRSISTGEGIIDATRKP